MVARRGAERTMISCCSKLYQHIYKAHLRESSISFRAVLSFWIVLTTNHIAQACRANRGLWYTLKMCDTPSQPMNRQQDAETGSKRYSGVIRKLFELTATLALTSSQRTLYEYENNHNDRSTMLRQLFQEQRDSRQPILIGDKKLVG